MKKSIRRDSALASPLHVNFFSIERRMDQCFTNVFNLRACAPTGRSQQHASNRWALQIRSQPLAHSQS
eukprot:1660411-Rhodomonas_salina.2